MTLFHRMYQDRGFSSSVMTRCPDVRRAVVQARAHVAAFYKVQVDHMIRTAGARVLTRLMVIFLRGKRLYCLKHKKHFY
jgi:hypothetical protein